MYKTTPAEWWQKGKKETVSLEATVRRFEFKERFHESML